MTDKEKKEYKKEYRRLNPDKIKEEQANWRSLNQKVIKSNRKKYYALNKERIKAKSKKYREENKDKKRESDKKYQLANKEKIAAGKRLYKAKRIKNDPLFKLTLNIGALIRSSFKSVGFKKNAKSEIILGCTVQEFKEHIEKQFESWMNWNNQGLHKPGGKRTWQIDHIIPMKSAKTEEDIIKLNHHSNLRPLCSKENLDRR